MPLILVVLTGLATGLATGQLLALLVAATALDTPSIASLAQHWGLRWGLLLASLCWRCRRPRLALLLLPASALALLLVVGLAGGLVALLEQAGLSQLGQGFPHPARQAAAEAMLHSAQLAGLVVALPVALLSFSPLTRPAPVSAPGGLVIVQNRETQFDAPLYSRIAQDRPFALQVVYTAQAAGALPPDPELGFAPGWDHLSASRYNQRNWPLRSPWAVLRLARWIQRQRPDLVIVCGYYPPAHLLLSLLLRLVGQPIGLRSDNTLRHTRRGTWRRQLQARLVGAIQRLHHTWHPVGDQALAYLRTISGADRPSFRFAYAVDNDWFAAGAHHSRQQRTAGLGSRGWPPEAFVVLGIVKWTSREDPITLVRAFLRLHAAHPLARLILVGDGPLRAEVEALLAPLRPAAWLPGYVPYSRLPSLYGMADVFVHPCPDEPWGVSVNEALASGLPVLAASGVGAAAELLAPQQVVADGDAPTLASQLLQLAQDPALGRRLVAEASQRLAGYGYCHTIVQFQAALALGAGLRQGGRH